MFENELTEYEKYWEKLGKCLGYIDMDCINCGRHRVEQYENGLKVCEKCGFNQDTKEHEDSYYMYI